MFNLFNYENEIDYSNYRLTVDTKEDYELLKIIYDSLYSKNKIFLMKDVIEFLKKNPDLVNINKHIEQKKLKE
jgi:spore coat polysaccharide biosynthesis protein SpsF